MKDADIETRAVLTVWVLEELLRYGLISKNEATNLGLRFIKNIIKELRR